MIRNNYRFYEIDLLRFLAAIFIVAFHYAFRGNAADNFTVLAFDALSPFSRYGYLGVNLFFIISGFVILLSAYKKTASDFVVSRIVRLYPAYWFCVTVTFLTILMIGSPKYKAEFFQYLTNLTMFHKCIGIESIDAVYWTLEVELRFYFLIFILILIKQLKIIKYFLGLWLALTLILTKYDIKFIGSSPN